MEKQRFQRNFYFWNAKISIEITQQIGELKHMLRYMKQWLREKQAIELKNEMLKQTMLQHSSIHRV